MTCGDLQVIARVSGPQCSYCAKVNGALLVAAMAEDQDTFFLTISVSWTMRNAPRTR